MKLKFAFLLPLFAFVSIDVLAGNCTSGFVETAKITMTNNMANTQLSNGAASSINSEYYGWKTKPPTTIAAKSTGTATVGFCCNPLTGGTSSKSAYIQYQVGSNGECTFNFEVKCDHDHEYLHVNSSSCTAASLTTKNSDPNISYTVSDVTGEESADMDLDSE